MTSDVELEKVRSAWHDVTCPECRDRSLHRLGTEAIVHLMMQAGLRVQ